MGKKKTTHILSSRLPCSKQRPLTNIEMPMPKTKVLVIMQTSACKPGARPLPTITMAVGLPWWLSGKESTCNIRDAGSIPGWGRSPGGGHGDPLQYSCLENPMDRGAWQPYGLARFGHEWSNSTHTWYSIGTHIMYFFLHNKCNRNSACIFYYKLD